MITKAIIVQKILNSNKYTVRIPLFEEAGTTRYFLQDATASVNPGTYAPYKPGDTVYIAFEDGAVNQCCIIGSLLLEGNLDYQKQPKTFQYIEDLTVNNKVVLPKNTKIGDIDYDILFSLINKVQNIQDSVSSLLTSISGYDKNKKQTLKNINGTFTWVDDE